jgi:cell division protease FtsH
MLKNNLKLIGIVLAALLILKMGFGGEASQASAGSSAKAEVTSYDEFAELAELDDIKSATFSDVNIFYTTRNGQEHTTRIPSVGDDDILNILLKNDVKVVDKPKPEAGFFSKLIINILPTVLFIGFIYMILSKQSNKMQDQTGLNKKKTFHAEDRKPVFFDDVAGCDEAKADVKEVVDFLKNPQKYWALGAKIPHGVLLQGPPGNGKTLLARAVAGEAGVPFFSISGSDFVEKYVGVGAARVRELFDEARKNAPCIIFIDEIDAMGKQRSSGGNGGHEEREQTLNQMLVEMDGFGSEDAIIVIAATNRSDILDNALVRPGRFDRQVNVGLPDVRGREQILKVHARNKKVSNDINYQQIAQGTAGFSGAELANLVNEAVLCAVRSQKSETDKVSFDEAKDKIIMGSAKNNFAMKEKEKSLTSYHEAGHAIIGHLMKEKGLHDPVYKVSIIPRERALGVTVYLPEEDRYSLSKGEAKARIMTLLGGRIAEEMVTAKDGSGVTTGASNDIERATQYATKMVTAWGLSEIGSGIRQLGKSDEHSPEPLVSGKTREAIDTEINKILSECYEEARELLYSKGEVLEEMHDALMVREVITNEDVEKLMNGEKLETYENYEGSFKEKDRIHDIKEVVEKSNSKPVTSTDLAAE